LIRLIADPECLRSDYLNYYLNWQPAQDRLRRLATRGVSQSNISAAKLRGFVLPVPTLAEQRTIANLLSAVDSKIQAETRRREALQSLFKSMLHHLMTGQVRVK
jgi:type I restriction enzyme S subunit